MFPNYRKLSIADYFSLGIDFESQLFFYFCSKLIFKMKKFYTYLAAFVIVFLVVNISVSLAGGPPPPPPGGGGPPCFPPPCMPIDGGISFLLAAGAAFGAKKVYDSRKNSAENKN